MTALTLVEASKLAADGGDTKRAAIIALYAENSDIMNAMSFDGIAGNAYQWTQEGDLPTTAFRGVNEAYTPNNGTFNPQKAALMIAGGELDVDNFIVKTEGDGVRSRHEALKVKALSQAITLNIISGDNTSDPRQFDGLQKMCTGTQLIDDGASSGGDALSLKKLDQLIDQVNHPTHLIMSRSILRKFTAAFRSSTFPNGLFSMDGQSDGGMGKRIMRYNGLEILTGYGQTKNTALLGYTEASPGGGSSVSTSIYCCNFGAEDGVIGISNGGLMVNDLGLLQSAPVWRTRIEWYLAMIMLSPYSAARLDGIKDVDIVA